jgi:hypothetical protein
MKTLAAGLVGVVIAGIIMVPFSIRHLDAATRLQCQTQDWPVAQAQAHEAFCATYLDKP